MKKLIYIFTALLLSFSFTACMPEGMPPEDDSLPTIDIVERSQLLDMVTVDHILSEKDKQLLADMGVTVTMSDFALTADDRAGFTLHFTTESSQEYHSRTEAVIDFDMPAQDTFTNIRFYWGSMSKAGDRLLVTYLDRAVLVPVNDTDDGIVEFNLSFLNEKGGYIVHTSNGFEKYAFMYYTPEEEGVVIADANGNSIAHISQPVKDVNIRGLLTTRTEEMIADVPFSYQNTFAGDFITDNLFFIDQGDIAGIVDCENNLPADSDIIKTSYDLTVDNVLYKCYLADNDVKKRLDYGYIAIREENGDCTGCVLVDTNGMESFKYSSNKLSLEENGNLVSYNELSGLQFTMDFDSGNTQMEYIITEDMLGEKLAQSKDGRYSIYEYGKHSIKHYWTSYRALKDEKTGEIKFLSDYYAKNYTDISLETGFFSNNEIYLMYDYDFEIYNPENIENGPVLNIGKKFPLGIEGEDGYRKNTLWAVRRDPVDKTFIVVHDHLGPDRWYYTEDRMDGNYFKDTYDVALLDKDGNIIKSFTTEMKVPANTKILNISLSGDILTMENMDSTTGKTVQKATLNISTGKFKKII